MDAKDNYAWQLGKDGNWQKWFDGPTYWREIAQNQVKAAQGIPIEWHFSQKEVADMVRPVVKDLVNVIYTPSVWED